MTEETIDPIDDAISAIAFDALQQIMLRPLSKTDEPDVTADAIDDLANRVTNASRVAALSLSHVATAFREGGR